MPDFTFISNKRNHRWLISTPSRSQRTNAGQKQVSVCPFCPGREQEEEELYRIGGEKRDSNWHIRVVSNKFPFAYDHEIIIHSPDHHKRFDELPYSQVELILRVYRQRFQAHQKKGSVYIFNNSGLAAGGSLLYP